MADVLLTSLVAATSVPTNAALLISRPDAADASKRVFGLLATAAISGASYTLPAATTTTRGGIVVGANLTLNGDVLNAPAPTPAYTLPVASTSTMGGIKPGANVTISSNGTLTVPAPAGTYSLPAATATVRGGITVGAGLTISADVLSLGAATATVRGGVRIGANIGLSGDTISVAAPYVLPAATATVIGGVRPGTGLAVDANGVLSTTATAAAARTQRAITAAGTDTPTANEQFILALPAATGVVAITLLDALTQPVEILNRKADASAANRLIRITPAAPAGGGTARTIEGDPFLDLDAGYLLKLTPVGRDWIATGYPA